ncbi:MAG TPA: MFS transporter [Candidatus Blautia faecavium]|uniref:MFS transporter n=1 Tax=Candidatus Blautia faecavium TaxID=2838487 RepID=A0A9D2RY37_9FIRM|nr:MFS transporter [Candidatus Blautia faecavium]
MKQKKTLSFLNYAAILSIFFFAGGGTFMNAALQTMIDAWPELPVSTVRLVTSLPCLISCPVIILTGHLAGRTLSYRFCAIFGTLLILLGGIAPFFFDHSWTLILIFRAILGIGVGFTGMRNALLLRSVPKEKQSAMTGYGSGIMNSSNIVTGPIVGILAGVNWKTPFLFNLLAIVVLLLLTFYLKEPEPLEESEEKSTSAAKAKNPEGWKIPIYIILQFILTVALYPVLSGMSTFMDSRGIGSSFMAGISNLVYGLAGLLINLVLSQLMRLFRQYLIPAMCLCFSLGMAVIVFLPSLPTVLIGVALVSSGFNTMMALFQVYNGKVSTPAQLGLSSTFIVAALNLGNFVSVYYINACHSLFSRTSDVESAFLGSMTLNVIIAVIALVVKLAPKEEYSSSRQPSVHSK